MASLAIQSILLEHAVAKGYMELLAEHADVLRKSLGHSPIASELHLRIVLYSLENFVKTADHRKDDVAAALITSLLDLDHQVVASNLLTKALLSLQVSVLFDMLQKDDKNVLAKLNTFFPASGFSHPNVEQKLILKLTNAQKNFRKFFIPLIADRMKRAAYMSGDYHLEFGEGLLKKSMNLLEQCCEKLQMALPPTSLERLLQSQKKKRLVEITDSHGNALFKTFLHEIGKGDHLNEAKVLDLLEKFTDISSKKKSQTRDDSTSEDGSFEESSAQITNSTGTSLSQSQRSTQVTNKNDSEDETSGEEIRPRRATRRKCAPKKYAESSSEDSEDSEDSEEEEEDDDEEDEESENTDKAGKVIILSSTEDTDESHATQASKQVRRVIVKEKPDKRNGNNKRDLSSDLSAFQVKKKSNKGKIARRPTQAANDFDSTESEIEDKKASKKTTTKVTGSKEQLSKKTGTPKSAKKAVKANVKEGTNSNPTAAKSNNNSVVDEQAKNPQTPVSGKKKKDVPKVVLKDKRTPRSAKKDVKTPKSGIRKSVLLKENDVSEDTVSESDDTEDQVTKPVGATEKDVMESRVDQKKSTPPRRTSKRRSECSSANYDTTDGEDVASAKPAVIVKSPSPVKIARLRSASQVASSPARRESRRLSQNRSNAESSDEQTTTKSNINTDAEECTRSGRTGAPTPKTPKSLPRTQREPLTPKVIIAKSTVSSAKKRTPEIIDTKLQESANSSSNKTDNTDSSGSEDSEVIPVYYPTPAASMLTRRTRNSPMPGSAGSSKRPKRSLPSSAENQSSPKRRAASPEMMPSPKPISNADADADESDDSWRTCSEPDSSADENDMSEKSKTIEKKRIETSPQVVNARRKSLRKSGASIHNTDSTDTDVGQTQSVETSKKEKISGGKSNVQLDPIENLRESSPRRRTRSSGAVTLSSKSSSKAIQRQSSKASKSIVLVNSSSDSDIEEVQTVSVAKLSSLRKLSRENFSPLPDLKKHLKSPLVKPCVVLLIRKMEVSTALGEKTVVHF